ncbi:hypothetical protein BROUX41_005194 [Berkeleyomyces rouxiae]
MSSFFKAPPSSFRHYICAQCGDWCKIDEFSVFEINKLIKRQRSEKVTAEKSGMVCKKHTANVEPLYLCNGPCNREQPASCYSQRTRKNGDYICNECAVWKGMADRGMVIAAPGHQLSVDEVQEAYWQDPVLAYPMARIELDLKHRAQGFHARRELPVPRIQGPGRYYVSDTPEERLKQGFDKDIPKCPEMVRHQYQGFVPPVAFKKEYEAMMAENKVDSETAHNPTKTKQTKGLESSVQSSGHKPRISVYIESKNNKKSQDFYIQEYCRWVDKKKPEH